jgi:hypothetical protein
MLSDAATCTAIFLAQRLAIVLADPEFAHDAAHQDFDECDI